MVPARAQLSVWPCRPLFVLSLHFDRLPGQFCRLLERLAGHYIEHCCRLPADQVGEVLLDLLEAVRVNVADSLDAAAHKASLASEVTRV